MRLQREEVKRHKEEVQRQKELKKQRLAQQKVLEEERQQQHLHKQQQRLHQQQQLQFQQQQNKGSSGSTGSSGSARQPTQGQQNPSPFAGFEVPPLADESDGRGDVGGRGAQMRRGDPDGRAGGQPQQSAGSPGQGLPPDGHPFNSGSGAVSTVCIRS